MQRSGIPASGGVGNAVIAGFRCRSTQPTRRRPRHHAHRDADTSDYAALIRPTGRRSTQSTGFEPTPRGRRLAWNGTGCRLGWNGAECRLGWSQAESQHPEASAMPWLLGFAAAQPSLRGGAQPSLPGSSRRRGGVGRHGTERNVGWDGAKRNVGWDAAKRNPSIRKRRQCRGCWVSLPLNPAYGEALNPVYRVRADAAGA